MTACTFKGTIANMRIVDLVTSTFPSSSIITLGITLGMIARLTCDVK